MSRATPCHGRLSMTSSKALRSIQPSWVLGALLLLGCGGADLNGNGITQGPGGTTTSTSCLGDPDLPASCTFWTCMDVPAQYSAKTHCTSPQPPGAAHPGGTYMCTSGLYC